MKKNVLIGLLLFSLILTGCSFNKKEETKPQEKEEVITGVNSTIQYNSNEEGATVTKIKFEVINNSEDDYQINTITFDVTLKNDEIKYIEKDVNKVVKKGEKYKIEVESDVAPSEVKNIGYNAI